MKVRTGERRGRTNGKLRPAVAASLVLFAFLVTPAGSSAAATWSIVASPDIRGGANYLYGVGGSSASDVWAVGEFAGVPNGPYLPLTEHWNGRSWTVVKARAPAGGEATL